MWNVLTLTGLPAAPPGDSDAIQVGQSAIAIGNPLDFERTVTRGIIAGVGINTAVLRDLPRAPTVVGLGFAAPINQQQRR